MCMLGIGIMPAFSQSQRAAIYPEVFPGILETGSVKMEVFNSSNSLVTTQTYSIVSDAGFSKYIPTAVGTYRVRLTNQTLAVMNTTVCQIDGCNGAVQQQACGKGNAPNARKSSAPIAAGAFYEFNLVITDRADFGTRCPSGISADLDYFVGGIYVTTAYHSQPDCEDVDVTPTFGLNKGTFVNDSTYNVASGESVTLTTSCPQILYDWRSEIEGQTGTSVTSTITANRVYRVRCKVNDCVGEWKRVFINVAPNCNTNSPVSSITGIVMNNNYTGTMIFLVQAPPPTVTSGVVGTMNVRATFGNNTTVNIRAEYYDHTLGYYLVDIGTPLRGYVTAPETGRGAAIAKLNSEVNSYKVNYQYTSFGAEYSPQNPCCNAIKPQGLSVTFANCVDGKVRVYGNSEGKMPDNNYYDRAMLMTLQQLQPTLGPVVSPTFYRKFRYDKTNSDNGSAQDDGGSIWDLGFLNSNTTYNFRVGGMGGVATNDYSDISFTTSCPNPTIAGTRDICLGQSVTLTASGCVSNICWSTGQNTPTITVKPSITSVYSVRCLTTDEDNNSASFTVNVNSNNSEVIITGNKAVYLPGENVTLTAAGCTGTVNWSDGTVGLTNTKVAVANYIVSAWCVNAAGCTSKTSNYEVIVRLDPPVVVSNVPEVCAGTSTITLSASGCAAGAGYLWSNGVSSTSATSSITVPAVKNQLYWVVCYSGQNLSVRKLIYLK